MQFGTKDTAITKDSNIGKALSNTDSTNIAKYNVFALVLKINANDTNYYETYMFNRGWTNVYYFEVASYWCAMQITLGSNNTFSIYSRRAPSLNNGTVTGVASIYQIYAIG